MSDPNKKQFFRVRYSRAFQSVENATVQVSAEDVLDAIAIAKEKYEDGGVNEFLEWKEDADSFEVLDADVTVWDEDGRPHVKLLDLDENP